MKRRILLTLLVCSIALPSYGARIKSVNFINLDSKSRIQIGVTGKVTYDVELKGNNVLLRLMNTHIARNLARPYITKDFITPIDHFIPLQVGNDVLFKIYMKEMSPYLVSQDKDIVFMDFDIPKDIRKAKPEAKTPLKSLQKKPMKKIERPGKNLANTSKARNSLVMAKASTLSSSVVATEKKAKYTGKKISLDLQNADIHNVLRIIADVSGLNIVTSDDVKGRITLRLKNVPWDQVLDVVLASKDLGKMQIGNVVRIAPADKIKAAEQRELESIKTKEKLEPLVTSIIPVNFAKASDIAKTVKGKNLSMISKRGSITAEDRTNVLIVKDIKKNVDAVYAMVKRLDKPTPQVLIEARIVQADNDWVRGLGVQWGGAFRNQSSKYSFGLSGVTTGDARNLFNTTSSTYSSEPLFSTTVVPSPSFAVNFPMNQAAGFGITFGRLGNSILDLDLRLDIGETTGRTRVIARPRVVTLDNKKAIIKQGEKYPYIVRNQEGELSTELKDMELVLEVTPRVAFDKSVDMEISVRRNAIGAYTNSLGDPSIASREAQTEVLVKNGETSVIGGIIENVVQKNENRVPGLWRLPIIGYLFKGKKDEIQKKELLIFITPHVIEPINL